MCSKNTQSVSIFRVIFIFFTDYNLFEIKSVLCRDMTAEDTIMFFPLVLNDLFCYDILCNQTKSLRSEIVN